MRVHERLAILGGADPADPLEPNNRIRHIAAGGLIICIAAWACIAATGMFHSNLKVRWPLALGGGLLLATIIFCIDLLITCTPLKKDTFWYRSRIIFIRGMVSLAIGLVIAHSSILFMYRDALETIVSRTNQAAAQIDANRIRANSQWPSAIANAKQQIAEDQSGVKSANSSFGRVQGEIVSSRNKWLDDRLCVHGSLAADGDQCGPGPVSDALRKAYQELADNFPAVQASHASTVKKLDVTSTALNNTMTTDQNKLQKQIQSGVKADLANTGLAAQSEALWQLLRQNAFLWLWPIFFFIIDLAVALMKGTLPESDFDLKRRRSREQDERIEANIKDSPVWQQVADHVARSQAIVAIVRANAAAAREIAAIQSRQVPIVPQPPSPRTPSTPSPAPRRTPARKRFSGRERWLRKVAWAGFPASVVLTLAITLTGSTGQGPNSSADVEIRAFAGHSITLRGGERLTIPTGAVAGNAPVTASYTAGQTWPGNTPASAEVKFATTGKLIRWPVLSLHVPNSERPIALSGALHIAFQSPGSKEWTAYPATYDAEADAMVATLTHFSTWRFWTLNWATDLAK